MAGKNSKKIEVRDTRFSPTFSAYMVYHTCERWSDQQTEVVDMKDVKKFLAVLSRELQRGEDFDIEARKILEDLHRDVVRIEETGESKVQPMLDRVKALESRFAANHPVLERTVRELADAIARMGI